MKPKVAINGFGRIGRLVFRINLEKNDLDIVALNDPSSVETMVHLVKYDSTYGPLDVDIEIKSENEIIVNGKSIRVTHDRNPENLPWKELDVDIAIESTGVFRDREGASKHLQAGAKRVLITAPGKNIDRTLVMGVNEEELKGEKDLLISNASCTTNCIAPAAKILNKVFGIKKGLMTTIHAYTNDQNILDAKHKDLRRARAGALSMIPTTTGAAKATGIVLPELDGKLNGMAVRVPTPTVSLVDFVFESEKETTVEEVNAALKAASEGEMKGILGYSDEPLVSRDHQATKFSSVVDALSTTAIGGNMIKVVLWYDNEWGYSERTVDMAKYIADRM